MDGQQQTTTETAALVGAGAGHFLDLKPSGAPDGGPCHFGRYAARRRRAAPARHRKRHADIRGRIYHGKIDTPKTVNSQRCAALGDGVSQWMCLWLETLPD